MATQNAAIAHKVEVVDEVKTRMGAATASIVSEYRGLTVAELADLRHALADLPPRDVLLARLAGALAAPMQQMAGLLEALPRNLAYGMQALIEQREAAGETVPAPEAPEAPEAAAPEASETAEATTEEPAAE